MKIFSTVLKLVLACNFISHITKDCTGISQKPYHSNVDEKLRLGTFEYVYKGVGRERIKVKEP